MLEVFFEVGEKTNKEETASEEEDKHKGPMVGSRKRIRGGEFFNCLVNPVCFFGDDPFESFFVFGSHLGKWGENNSRLNITVGRNVLGGIGDETIADVGDYTVGWSVPPRLEVFTGSGERQVDGSP